MMRGNVLRHVKSSGIVHGGMSEGEMSGGICPGENVRIPLRSRTFPLKIGYIFQFKGEGHNPHFVGILPFFYKTISTVLFYA